MARADGQARGSAGELIMNMPDTAKPGAAMKKSEPVSKTESDRLFHALGDPTRRAMLDRLVHGPLSVSALAAPLGITITAVAQHLQILEECELVRTEKVGRVRTCRIEMAGLYTLERWIVDHKTIWAQRMDQLGTLLDEIDEELK
jgi:DNA-binding transcriptional ArsR family regulator